MNDKLARLRELMREGYEVEDIRTEGDAVRATLRRGRAFTTICFRHEEAAELLYGQPRHRGRR